MVPQGPYIRTHTCTCTFQQLHHTRRLVGRAAIALTPDGGVSFICAFLPQGAALIVLVLLASGCGTLALFLPLSLSLAAYHRP